MNKGKIFVFEGSDCSGKQTQSEAIYKRMKNEGYNVRMITFPNYDSKSSGPVKMYLGKELGNEVHSISPRQASILYSADRVCSYLRNWKEFYESGGIIIMDRYVTSNIVHQAAKIDNIDDKMDFVKWCLDLEYNELELPIPDEVFFLNMPPKFSQLLNEKRKNKISGSIVKDLHESNSEFLKDSYNNAFFISKYLKWNVIDCVKDNELRSINDIHNDIYKELQSKLQNKTP